MNDIHNINFKLISYHNNRPFLADVRYLRTKNPKPVILFNHGFKGFKDWGAFNMVADHFAKAGFVFIKMNFSHNGTTIEKPTEFADLNAFGDNNFNIELDDTGVLLDYIFSKDCLIPSEEMSLENLYLCGHSRGGAMVILKANEDPRVKAIATWAAVNNLEGWYTEEELAYWKKHGIIYIHNSRTGQDMPLKYQIYEDYQNHRNRLLVPQAVKQLHIPFLAAHGTSDATVPVEAVYEMKKWNPDIELFIMEGTDHTFGATQPCISTKIPADTKIISDKTIEFFKSL